ncbi:MAG: hypothetical protein EBS01_15650, partial [Verrucomicrobia bacterium]|nr:hypothetical protein [Verrucomicrobiota bacterium]
MLPNPSASSVTFFRKATVTTPSHCASKGPLGKKGETEPPSGTCKATKRSLRTSVFPPAFRVRATPLPEVFGAGTLRAVDCTAGTGPFSFATSLMVCQIFSGIAT